MCPRKLLEGMLIAGQGTLAATELHHKVWGTACELDIGVLRRLAKHGSHSKVFISKTMAGVLYTRDRAAKLGSVENGNCSRCPQLADTQEHRAMKCNPIDTDCDQKGRKAWKLLAELESQGIP